MAERPASRSKSAAFAITEADLPVRFNRYLLIKRRSADAVGEEFLAVWGVEEGLDQLRVLRAIYPQLSEEAEFVALFGEEARALSRLASANVARIMEVSSEGGIPFVASEHVEGVTLGRLIELAREERKAWPWEISVHVITEILRGLDYVHRREDVLGGPLGLRHGDLRPENVLVSYDGEVKLTNFGSALYSIADEHTNARVERSRGIYAAPELGGADGPSVQGDIWAAAALLQAMLDPEARDSWAVEPERRPREPLVAFLERALHEEPAERYPDAVSMRESLLEIMAANAEGHPPDDLAAWASTLGSGDRESERETVRRMLGRDAKLELDETAGQGLVGAGTVLDGRYHLGRQLGEGGMGVVWEAEHLGIGRQVAVKVLHERVLDDEVAVERFRREARITGALGNPHIVGVSDFGVTAEGYHYLVMDLLEGESLAERIQQGSMDPWELARIMAGVCEGLAAAHAAGVVHRDLKPENVFLTGFGPKLLDFGIAKRTGLEETELALTRTGHICGTAEYLSPEQVRGQEPDFRSDIYGVGVMIYEALTLTTPFRGRTLGETLHKVMSDKLVSPRKRSGNQTIPRGLESICLKALSRKPERRFASAVEMREALSSFAADASLDRGSQPARVGQRSKLRLWISLFLVVFLGLLAVFMLIGVGRDVLEDDLAVVPLMGKLESDDVVKEPLDEPARDDDTAAEEPLVIDLTREPESEPPVKLLPSPAPKRDPEPSPEVEPQAQSRRPEALKLVKEGNAALAGLRLAEARKAFDRALSMDPRIPEAWYGLGRASFEQGEYRSAAGKVERALRLSPGHYRWRIYLGRIYAAMGEKDKAEAQWRRVLKTRPDNAQARGLLGVE